MEIPLVDFLLVGGGLTSATAAETLRAAGAEGSIAILCAETTLPYHRPPLSKGFLLKGPDHTNILIHDETFYSDREIGIHLGTRVCRLDADARIVETDRGHFRFDKLLIATGASLDRLAVPGANLPGIHYLRTADDALSLYESILHARNAVVIGASFLGMELAAALATRGIDFRSVLNCVALFWLQLSSRHLTALEIRDSLMASVEFFFSRARTRVNFLC